MKFHKVVIHSVRNIQELVFYPGPKFNYIVGVNGSGKTSLLESLYYFAHARSFRSHLVDRIINKNQEVMTIFGELVGAQQGHISIGIQRQIDKECKIYIQQQAVPSAAELAKLLPILLINPDSFSLLDGGSKPRRALIDWGVFHVEPLFYSLWQRFQRCLKQRNMALRQQLPYEQLQVWDEEFVHLAQEIDQFRAIYCEQLAEKFMEIITKIFPSYRFKCSYHRGWAKDSELATLLLEHYEQDKERGYSFYGPQRADLVLKMDNLPLQDFLSRGQQKLVVCALRIAQAQVLYQQTSKESIFLIDDLPAELGAEYRAFLIEALDQLNAQVYLTAIEQDSLLPALRDKEMKLFHVEQGSLREVESLYTDAAAEL